MSEKTEYHVLVTYDICNDRKRTKFATFLSGYGYRVQKSCFEAFVSNKLYKQILKAVPKFFKKEEDSIRVYLLSDPCKITNYGIP